MDVLLDTHAWVWSFLDETRLSQPARDAIVRAQAVRVSPISIFEIGQKVRIGKWPEMDQHLDKLPELLKEQGGLSAPLGPEIALLAATFDWPHRDPFDRFIAATAIQTGSVLISADAIFATLDDPRLQTLW